MSESRKRIYAVRASYDASNFPCSAADILPYADIADEEDDGEDTKPYSVHSTSEGDHWVDFGGIPLTARIVDGRLFVKALHPCGNGKWSEFDKPWALI
jgi:hypothetical protein